MKSNLFDEIEKEKKDFHDFGFSKEFWGKHPLNFYQIVAIVVMCVGFVGGILIGNLFPACRETSSFFGTCTSEMYNFGLTLMVWASTFLFSLFIYGLGHIIGLLEAIYHKMK